MAYLKAIGYCFVAFVITVIVFDNDIDVFLVIVGLTALCEAFEAQEMAKKARRR